MNNVFKYAIEVKGSSWRDEPKRNGRFLEWAVFAVHASANPKEALRFLKEEYYADVNNTTPLVVRIVKIEDNPRVKAWLSYYLELEDSSTVFGFTPFRLYGQEFMWENEDGYIFDYPSGRQPWVKTLMNF